MNPRRLTASLMAAAALGIAAPAALAAPSQYYGLLRSRDLTAFGFLRLDMRPAYAVSIEPGTWAIETELGYQNTWALSENVEEYLTSLEPTGRRDLGPDEYAAIQALPGENYLLDLESASFDLTFHYKFSKNWTGYAIVSAVSYQGGFLDSTIESFHDAFGFSTFGRLGAKRNDINLIYDLKGAQVASFGSPTDGGFTDPTLGIRFSGIDMPEKWALSFEGAVKIPVGGERTLLSTGKTDVGVQMSVQRFYDHHALYLNLAAVYYAGAEFPVEQDATFVPTLIFGYEKAMTDRTNINLQGYISKSVYDSDQTDLDELLSEKYQLTLGVRHRINQFLISFGITENLQNFNNTPDIGLQLGVAYLPSRVERTRK
ncbi:hypothetical protein HNQ60_000354 [Povalibacter uvarum]|uniref:DUF3187 family protein n=1 Tax=Povalibacter uvarum TaxID=732238 RepID=A0A841HGT4_9GAMM|nr:DUF3187 family protein [Povalibacter uvarum]MBB6091508.1 hypothetical protein [Povalibacter uvarum]